MKVVIAMPAFNAARTLEKTYFGLPEHLRRHVLLGDNRSADGTVEVAKRLGIKVLQHDKNYGYGGNLKRLYRHVLAEGADIVVELHPDFQYEPGLVDIFVAYIERGYFDVIHGNRIRRRDEAMAGGMHWYRYFGNRILSTFENLWFGVNFGEWHCGMKAYRAEVLACLPLERYANTHAFATDIAMDCVKEGFRVAEVPIPIRYTSESSSVDVPRLFAYAGRLLWSALQRPPWKRKRFGFKKLPPLNPGYRDECLVEKCV